ncbi:MAG: hypothetical protein UZ22_OP11002001058 [Microgenomates bacterium OLB23]|nr:MAG: hypothetical protein UZ22_OP11002001058 [Microgenomates bacterium OLB23]
MNYRISQFEKHSDHRGDLIVFLKNSELGNNFKQFGQIYFVTFEKKGTVRGNHYHNKWHEWFGIVAGEIEVTLEDVKTKEKVSLILDAKKNKYMRLEIGPYVAHTFRSISEYAALINYADSEWYSDDTVHYKID